MFNKRTKNYGFTKFEKIVICSKTVYQKTRKEQELKINTNNAWEKLLIQKDMIWVYHRNVDLCIEVWLIYFNTIHQYYTILYYTNSYWVTVNELYYSCCIKF